MTTVLDLEQPIVGEQAEKELTFADFKFPPFLQDGLRRLKFERPTVIQAQAIPFLMSGQDLVAQSQTGSGKTAAFALPLLARVQRQSSDLQALIMVPTRELALQVTQVFKALAGPNVRITTIYGGAGMEGQIRGLTRGGYQIVVGTPGRLRDHLNRGTLKLHRLRMLVLDEADEMLDRGFAPDVEAIISAAPAAAQRQTALFSATLPEWVAQTAAKHLRPTHATIKLEMTSDSRPDIAHLVYDMSMADKGVALRHLLDTHSSQPILVFARTKHGVKKLAAKLESEGYSVAGLQGNLSQSAREQVMSDFRTNRVRIMVATNVGARGLDVSGISHVINHDLPESAELFTHRVGRTGRNGASGTAITFLTGEDRAKWREIERTMKERGVQIERQAWAGPRATPESIAALAQAGAQFDRDRRNEQSSRSFDSASRPAGRRSEFGGRRDSQPRDFDNRRDAQPRDFDNNRKEAQPRDFGNRRDAQPRDFGNARKDAQPRDFGNRRDAQPRDFDNNRKEAQPREFDNTRREAPARGFQPEPARREDRSGPRSNRRQSAPSFGGQRRREDNRAAGRSRFEQ